MTMAKGGERPTHFTGVLLQRAMYILESLGYESVVLSLWAFCWILGIILTFSTQMILQLMHTENETIGALRPLRSNWYKSCMLRGT